MGRGGELSLNIQKPLRYVPEKPKADPPPKVGESFFRKAWGMEIVMGICLSVVGLLFLTVNMIIRDHKTETAVLGGGLFSFGVLVTYIGVCKYRSTIEKAQKRHNSFKTSEPSESDPLSIASECSRSDARSECRSYTGETRSDVRPYTSESRSDSSKVESSNPVISPMSGYNRNITLTFPINNLNKGSKYDSDSNLNINNHRKGS